MSGVIHLSSDKPAWLYAGWVFRQVLEDVASQHPNDSEMIEALRRAEACGWLFLDSLDDADLSARLTSAIKEVATGILSGKIRSGIEVQPYGDARTIQQYRETLPELLHVLSS